MSNCFLNYGQPSSNRIGLLNEKWQIEDMDRGNSISKRSIDLCQFQTFRIYHDLDDIYFGLEEYSLPWITNEIGMRVGMSQNC